MTSGLEWAPSVIMSGSGGEKLQLCNHLVTKALPHYYFHRFTQNSLPLKSPARITFLLVSIGKSMSVSIFSAELYTEMNVTISLLT